ncbi:DUF945 family protein [Modicisalibacter luteus]|uniref:DUF945 family protein n=1 Tax=Modicisalibacter luteus TaxID=453962 RepID=UPI0036319BC1
MRRTWWVVILVMVLGVAGYLGAQAYASHIFEQELGRTIEALRDDGQWEVERKNVEQGWFQSQGHLQLSPTGDDRWQAEIPYNASHGILSTRLNGAVQILLSEDGDTSSTHMVFGDVLPSAEPRWTATFHTLDRQADGRLDVAGFELSRDEAQLSFSGAEFTAEGRLGDVAVQGQIAPIRWQQGREQLAIGPVHLNSRYQSSDDYYFHQRNELILNRLDYQGPQRAPVTLTGVHYSDETRLDDQLRLDMSLSLEQAQVAGEPLLAGRVDASLDRLDGQAARQLARQVETMIEEEGGDLSGLDEGGRRRLLQRLEPTILSMLENSPRFILEGATLSSSLFGVDTRGHGELVFDGQNVRTLSVLDLLDTDASAWRERLDGRFTWNGIPPWSRCSWVYRWIRVSS